MFRYWLLPLLGLVACKQAPIASVDAGAPVALDAGHKFGASGNYAFPIGPASGDWSGTFPAGTNAKINGATVPAAGSLTTGNSLHVSGASALSYSALNLGGGAGWVTGTLPAGNQAAQTMGGAVGGTTAASTISLTANGSITGVLPAANQAAQSLAGAVGGNTGASTISLTGNASITGLLPVAKLAPCTAAQFLVTNAGATAQACVSLSGKVTSTAAGVTSVSLASGDLPLIALSGDVACSGTGGSLSSCNVSAISGSTPIAITPNELRWIAGATAPLLDQATAASDVPTAALTIQSQAPFASASTNVQGGDVNIIVAPSLPISGATPTGAVRLWSNGYNFATFGIKNLDSENGNMGMVWLGGAAAVPTTNSSDYAFASNLVGFSDVETYINASNGAIHFQTGATDGALFNGSSLFAASDNAVSLGFSGRSFSDVETYTLDVKGAITLDSPNTIACGTGGTHTVGATPSPGLIITSGTLASNCVIDFSTNASTGFFTLDMSGVTLGATFGVQFKNGTATKTYTSSGIISGTLATIWTHGTNTLAVNF